ncbi:MAG: hypothetical protein ACOYXA_09320 [Bacteroidota bacterium]
MERTGKVKVGILQLVERTGKVMVAAILLKWRTGKVKVCTAHLKDRTMSATSSVRCVLVEGPPGIYTSNVCQGISTVHFVQ